ncbi:extracellular solute-binding protein [Paenibacillus sp. IB182496]|uniref:Extracellular solute-binding protein n=1 Tax=Paenibacillus sabuli TaxID=2772509 RepID=A0A927GQ35_9BACL|nr:extracellular solute-binding protein [Paenibacillus sabuli]MBD2844109.1 extracellular solute-binding protein [Paenibacillus sabuli]
MAKKQWLKTGTVALLALALTACSSGGNNGNAGGQNESGSGGTNAAAEGKTKIAYWTMDRHDMDFMQDKVDAFNAENEDNIEVEMTVLADNYNQAVEVAYASNQAPDILRIFDFVTYVKKGYLAELDGFMDDEFRGKFESVLAENVNMIDGKLYSLPNTGQYWRLIYNKDLFEQAGLSGPPQTLDEMVEYAKKITEAGKAEGAYGFASNFKNNSGFTRPAYAVGTLSSDTSHEGYNIQSGQYDTGMYKDVVQAMRQMKEDGSMLPGAETLDIDPLRAQFAQGKIGMYVNHSSEPAVYANQFPTEVDWAAAVVPTASGEPAGVTWVNAGAYLGINAHSDKQEAAYKFMEYLYGEELRVDYQEAGYGISVLPYVNEAAGAPEIAGIEGFLPTAYDGLYPATPLSITETKLEGLKMSDAFTRYIMTGGEDLDALIADLDTRYNKALEAARAEGLTNIEANPDFSAAALQSSLASAQ